MGHKVIPLIFRSKNYPCYSNIWNNFFSIFNRLISYVYFTNFIKKNKKSNIIFVQINDFNKNCTLTIILYSKIEFTLSKQYIKLKVLSILKRKLLQNTKLFINFVVLKHPLLSTHIILKYLSKKFLFSKITIRKIIPQLALLINYNYKLRGLKCIISGRINGVQMAKSETFKFCENSLQFKTRYIKYNYINISTKYGLLGVKLWLFLD